MPRLSAREQDIRVGRAIQARQLRDHGWSLRAIAKELRIDKRTVQRDLESGVSGALGSTRPRKRPTNATGKPGSNVIELRRKS